MAELRKIGSRLDALEKMPRPQPAQPTVPSPGDPFNPVMPPATEALKTGTGAAEIFAAKCAQCHTSGKLNPDTSFALLDAAGKVLPLSDQQGKRVLTKTYGGKMPPRDSKIPPLTDEEVASIVAFIEKGK